MNDIVDQLAQLYEERKGVLEANSMRDHTADASVDTAGAGGSWSAWFARPVCRTSRMAISANNLAAPGPARASKISARLSAPSDRSGRAQETRGPGATCRA